MFIQIFLIVACFAIGSLILDSKMGQMVEKTVREFAHQKINTIILAAQKVARKHRSN